MKKNCYSFRRMAAALLSALAALPMSAQEPEFTPDLFPGQTKHRTELEIDAVVNVGEFGQATNMKSWITNLTSTNESVVQTYNQNGYTAVLIVGTGKADVTYTETMFTSEEGGAGASAGGDGSTGTGDVTTHTIHYTVIKGAPTARYALGNETCTTAHLYWDGSDPYAFTFTQPALEIVIKEVYLEQNIYPKFRDRYIYEQECEVISTNTDVATVSRRGVNPVSYGSTTIRATWAGNENWVGESAEYELLVEKPKSSVMIGFESSTAAGVEGCIGDVLDAPSILVVPDGLTIDRWVSENPEIASVDATSGQVTLLKAGTTRIFAQRDEDENYYAAQAYYTLTVKKRPHGMSFDPDDVTAELGMPWTRPTLLNPDELKIEKWYSNNPDVADITEDGADITLKTTGTAVITCETFGDDTHYAGTASFTLRVTTIGVKVMGIDVTSGNCDDVLGDGKKTVVFNKATNTLTLNDFNVLGSDLSYEQSQGVIQSTSPTQLTINVQGVNSIMNVGSAIISNTAVVIMSTDKDNSLALTATGPAITAEGLKVYDSNVYAMSNDVAIKLGSVLSVYKGGHLIAETASTTVSAIECKQLELGQDKTGGIEILTEDVVFHPGAGFFGGTTGKEPAPRIEIGKVPVVVPDDEVTTIQFNVTDPDDNDALVFSASATDTYNEETGQLEISTALTDEQVATALETLIPGSSAWIALLPGSLVFDVPAGQGEITVSCITLPGYTLNLMIEGHGAVSITQETLGWAKVNYDVTEPTHVVIYLHAASSEASRRTDAADSNRAPAETGAYISAIKITPANVSTAIDRTITDAVQQPTTDWFDLSGRRLTRQPAAKGLYINGGRKVIVK